MSSDPTLPEQVREFPRVSLAIPVYNEEAVIPELLRRTTAVLDLIPGRPARSRPRR